MYTRNKVVVCCFVYREVVMTVFFNRLWYCVEVLIPPQNWRILCTWASVIIFKFVSRMKLSILWNGKMLWVSQNVWFWSLLSRFLDWNPSNHCHFIDKVTEFVWVYNGLTGIFALILELKWFLFVLFLFFLIELSLCQCSVRTLSEDCALAH